jgi:hypothetical protein
VVITKAAITKELLKNIGMIASLEAELSANPFSASSATWFNWVTCICFMLLISCTCIDFVSVHLNVIVMQLAVEHYCQQMTI